MVEFFLVGQDNGPVEVSTLQVGVERAHCPLGALVASSSPPFSAGYYRVVFRSRSLPLAFVECLLSTWYGCALILGCFILGWRAFLRVWSQLKLCTSCVRWKRCPTCQSMEVLDLGCLPTKLSPTPLF